MCGYSGRVLFHEFHKPFHIHELVSHNDMREGSPLPSILKRVFLDILRKHVDDNERDPSTRLRRESSNLESASHPARVETNTHFPALCWSWWQREGWWRGTDVDSVAASLVRVRSR